MQVDENKVCLTYSNDALSFQRKSQGIILAQVHEFC